MLTFSKLFPITVCSTNDQALFVGLFVCLAFNVMSTEIGHLVTACPAGKPVYEVDDSKRESNRTIYLLE